MAKIKITGDAMVITSAKRLEDIKILEKYRPKALMLFSEDGKEAIFKVGTTSGDGSIGAYGVGFNSASHDREKLATITKMIPSDVEDIKQYVEDTVGTAIINLNKVEENLDEALKEVADERAKIRENIVIE